MSVPPAPTSDARHRPPVVVTGAAGFIGGELCARFRREGRPLLALTRRAYDRMPPDLQVIGDLRHVDDATLDEAMSGAGAVVHLAGRVHVMRERAPDPARAYDEANRLVTGRLARAAARAGVERFVFASTIKVSGEETVLGHPFQPDGHPHPADAYARSKLAAEAALFEAAADSAMVPTVLRLPMVYGRHVGGNFARLVAGVLRGTPLPFASVSNRRSILYVRNLAAAIEAVLDAADPVRGVHFVTDLRSVSTPELIGAIANAWRVPARLSRFPPLLLEAAAALLGRGEAIRRLTRSLEADAVSFVQATGWEPPYTLERALARIAAHTRAGQSNATTRMRDLPTREP